MKKLILGICLACCGCEDRIGDAGQKVETTNPAASVVKLFDVDGISVYRFYDGSHPVYFTQKSADWAITRSCGKNCITTDEYETR